MLDLPGMSEAATDVVERSPEVAQPVRPQSEDGNVVRSSPTGPVAISGPVLAEGHHVFPENRKGISYDTLFGPYIAGASRIVVTDPYIRFFYQIKNMMEFVEMVIRRKAPEDQVAIHLVTGPDDGNIAKQRDLLDSIVSASAGTGVDFTWAYDGTGTAHARDILTDTGWKIVLDRGLDIFQAPIKSEGFSLADRMQEHRMVKGFYVTYVKQSG
jgi:ATP-dependent Lon protease